MFLKELLGTTDYVHFSVALIFAFIGAFVSMLIHASNRKKNSLTSPDKFSLSFLILDNKYRTMVNFILLILSVRFYPEAKSLFPDAFSDFMGKSDRIPYAAALSFGLVFDKILEFLRNKNIIDKTSIN